MPRARAEDSLKRLRAAAAKLREPIRLMEVCGTHTHAIGRGGLRSLFPENVDLVSGPGCPVCVTSQRDVERMLLLAQQPGVTVCTFGDMIRVPGINSSLEQERSNGADVRVVYSALDALDLAKENPSREVAFLAVGFETTTPGAAVVAMQARIQRITNFSLYTANKLVMPALEAVMAGGANITGFVTPGHVSVIIGAAAYEPFAKKYNVPCVVTGFEPADVLEGVAMLAEYAAQGTAGSFIQYSRAVSRTGNKRAWETLLKVFEPGDAEWRGLGEIPESGLVLRKEFRDMDAVHRFSLPEVPPVELEGCMCGAVLKGMIHPPECPFFGNKCTPRNPLGPCMVSSEGSCAARYKYG